MRLRAEVIAAPREVSPGSEIRLTRLDSDGDLLVSLAGFAALAGLAGIVRNSAVHRNARGGAVRERGQDPAQDTV